MRSEDASDAPPVPSPDRSDHERSPRVERPKAKPTARREVSPIRPRRSPHITSLCNSHVGWSAVPRRLRGQIRSFASHGAFRQNLPSGRRQRRPTLRFIYVRPHVELQVVHFGQNHDIRSRAPWHGDCRLRPSSRVSLDKTHPFRVSPVAGEWTALVVGRQAADQVAEVLGHGRQRRVPLWRTRQTGAAFERLDELRAHGGCRSGPAVPAIAWAPPSTGPSWRPPAPSAGPSACGPRSWARRRRCSSATPRNPPRCCGWRGRAAASRPRCTARMSSVDASLWPLRATTTRWLSNSFSTLRRGERLIASRAPT